MIAALTGQGINVRHACTALAVSESGCDAWKDRPDPPRTLRRIWLAGEIADIHKASGGTYGAHRVTAELRYGRSILAGHNAVESIMRELGIKGLPTRRLPRGARVAKVTSLDLVRRVFARDRPNELWMTDITEHPTREGEVFCAIVLDAFSRMIVGWTQTTRLVLNALGMATQRREHRDGLVIHSDRVCNSPLGRSARTSVTPAWRRRWERSARPMTTPSWRASGAGCRSSCSTDAGGRPGSSWPPRSTTTSSCFTTPAGGTPRLGC